MGRLLLVFCAVVLPGADSPETRFARVQPGAVRDDYFTPSQGQKRAVVLIQGLRQHNRFDDDKVPRAILRDWQETRGKIAPALAAEADVYAFAYGQDVDVPALIRCEGLRKGIQELQKASYTEIVLIGHSAGGVIARHFVEDNPDARVTKVIQMCSPNIGSPWGDFDFGLAPSQKGFIRSLNPQGRARYLSKRADVKVPRGVQFVCVVGSGGDNGDGVVSLASQWPVDLQQQGVPAVVVPFTHIEVLRRAETVEKVVELVRKDQPRWEGTKVAEARRYVFGEKTPPSGDSEPLDRQTYRLVLERRASEAEKTGDLQKMIECAFALHPLEQGQPREKTRSTALLTAAADRILTGKDPAAAQQYLFLCQPLLFSLPEKKINAIRGLARGKDVGKSTEDDAVSVGQLVRKLGKELVDPEAKPRGGLDRELAEFLGTSAFAQLYPGSALSDEPPTVEFKRTFPSPEEATLSITVRWQNVDAKIDARFLVKKGVTEMKALTIQDKTGVVQPDSRWLELLKREINRKLREP